MYIANYNPKKMNSCFITGTNRAVGLQMRGRLVLPWGSRGIHF